MAAAALTSAWEWQRPEGQWLRDGAARVSAASAEATQWTRQAAGQGVVAAKRAVGADKNEFKAPAPRDQVHRPVRLNVNAALLSVPEPLPSRPVDQAASAGSAGPTNQPVDLPRAPATGIWEAAGRIPGSAAGPPTAERPMRRSLDGLRRTGCRPGPGQASPSQGPPSRSPRGGVTRGGVGDLPAGEVESVRLVTSGGGPKGGYDAERRQNVAVPAGDAQWGTCPLPLPHEACRVIPRTFTSQRSVSTFLDALFLARPRIPRVPIASSVFLLAILRIQTSSSSASIMLRLLVRVGLEELSDAGTPATYAILVGGTH